MLLQATQPELVVGLAGMVSAIFRPGQTFAAVAEQFLY